MKTITTFILISFLAFSSCKNERIFFIHDDYNLVLKSAKHDKKLVFLDFYTVWCGGCKGYEKFVFTDSLFMGFLKANFYSARINAELQENKKIVKRYSIVAYPTLIIADSEGNEIDRIIGYKTEYGENSKLLIDKINMILSGEETLISMLKKYEANPDSIQLLRQIVIEKFIYNSDYKNLKKFALESINKSKSSIIMNELNFFYGIGCIRDKSEQNPNILKELLQSNISIDPMFITGGYSDLLKYYKNKGNNDSIDYYYNILINKLNTNDQSYNYYARQYAEFLYKNNIKIDLADKLTNDIVKSPGANKDHWTPYLKAHGFARHGRLYDGVKLFDDWMSENNDPNAQEIDLWNYYFYVDFAVFYQTNLNKALENALILEKNQPNIDNKMILANLLYLNKKNNEAIRKLKETIPMIESAEFKRKIDKLIEDYKN